MKLMIWGCMLVLATQGLGCATHQSFSREGGRYKVTWLANKVTRIECRGDRLPGGLLRVNIYRGRHSDKVLIKGNKQQVWARTVFKAGADIFSCSGVIFYEGGKQVNREHHAIKEWKLQEDNILIYRETVVSDDETGAFKRVEFFGPFEVALQPPG